MYDVVLFFNIKTKRYLIKIIISIEKKLQIRYNLGVQPMDMRKVEA